MVQSVNCISMVGVYCMITVATVFIVESPWSLLPPRLPRPWLSQVLLFLEPVGHPYSEKPDSLLKYRAIWWAASHSSLAPIFLPLSSFFYTHLQHLLFSLSLPLPGRFSLDVFSVERIGRLDVFKVHPWGILQTGWSIVTSELDPVSLRPLSGLPFRFPCRRWTHFLWGRQNVPIPVR